MSAQDDFCVQVLYLVAHLLITVLTGTPPLVSPDGLAWIAITLVAMMLVAQSTRTTGERLSIPFCWTEANCADRHDGITC